MKGIETELELNATEEAILQKSSNMKVTWYNLSHPQNALKYPWPTMVISLGTTMK